MNSLDYVNEYVRARLRRLRIEKGLKVTDMAQGAGLPVSSYACLESGVYRISLVNLAKILRALEADINEVWPAEDLESGTCENLATAKRTQVFRFNEVVRLTQAEGIALFRVRESDQKCFLVHHQQLSDFLLDRIILYLEDNRQYEHGLWFTRQRSDDRLVLFLKTSECAGYHRKLIEDYMTIWAEVF